MKHIIATTACSVIIMLFASANIVQANTCPRNGSDVDIAALHTAGPENIFGDFNCDYTPDGMRIKLYKIMLCSELVNETDYQAKCNPLVTFNSGKDIEISADNQSPILDGPVTLVEGDYTHAVILIENRIGSKFLQSFTRPIHGDNGVGTTCWSNGKDAKISYETVDGNGNRVPNTDGDHQNFSASCGLAASADPKWSYYTYKGLWMNGGFVNEVKALSLFGAPNKNVHLLGPTGNLASFTVGNGGRNNDDENGIVTNANYLLGVTELNPTVSISPSTTGLNLGFKLKDTFFQKITTNTYYGNDRCSAASGSMAVAASTGAFACLSTSYATTFDFKLEAY